MQGTFKLMVSIISAAVNLKNEFTLHINAIAVVSHIQKWRHCAATSKFDSQLSLCAQGQVATLRTQFIETEMVTLVA